MKNQSKIMVIDDSEIILKMIRHYLEKKNYRIVSASNGLEGIKLFEADASSFDLVITDIVMPQISGVGVISILKEKWPSLPIIAITGYGEHPEALAAEAKADMVLEKPIDLRELAGHIHALIGSSS